MTTPVLPIPDVDVGTISREAWEYRGSGLNE